MLTAYAGVRLGIPNLFSTHLKIHDSAGSFRPDVRGIHRYIRDSEVYDEIVTTLSSTCTYIYAVLFAFMRQCKKCLVYGSHSEHIVTWGVGAKQHITAAVSSSICEGVATRGVRKSVLSRLVARPSYYNSC